MTTHELYNLLKPAEAALRILADKLSITRISEYEEFGIAMEAIQATCEQLGKLEFEEAQAMQKREDCESST